MVTSLLTGLGMLAMAMLGIFLLGLFMAWAGSISGKSRLKADWDAKVAQHGYRKALLREALEYALFIVLVVIALALCGRVQS